MKAVAGNNISTMLCPSPASIAAASAGGSSGTLTWSTRTLTPFSLPQFSA